MRFFVYGTLKQGYGNNRLLDTAKFIGPAITNSAAFTLFNGGFPMVRAGGDNHIKGELYETDDPNVIQSLEGVPNMYYREEIEVRPLEGDTLTTTAFIYLGTDRFAKGWNNIIEPNDENISEWNR
jgi:gamma-glutamylcyclotransferase (GGCT)/AIG2-like uncharacterized protein YtfP